MLFAVNVVLAVLALGERAEAYPWLIRHGFAECRSCHVDPMGGETLTDMGRVMSQTHLSMPWSDDEPNEAAMLAFGLRQPEPLRLGGSVRLFSITDLTTGRASLFPMQSDLYGALTFGKLTVALSSGFARASRRYEHASKARVFGNVEDEGVLLVARNYWVGYELSDALLLRAGRLNLPFGLRIPEHTMWVRSETVTDRESDQQHGLGLALTEGPWRGELLLSLGNFQVSPDAIRERGYSAHVEYLLDPTLAIGASSMFLTAERDREVDGGRRVRHSHGLTARYVVFQPLVLLAEADVLKVTGAGLGYAGMAMLDYEPVRSLHLAVTGEVLDHGEPPDGARVGDGKPRLGTWLTANWFFATHFDARVDLVMRQNRANMLLAQLHFYF